jgi:hypothetical protein
MAAEIEALRGARAMAPEEDDEPDEGGKTAKVIANDHGKEAFVHTHEHEHTESSPDEGPYVPMEKRKKYRHTHEHMHDHRDHEQHERDFDHPGKDEEHDHKSMKLGGGGRSEAIEKKVKAEGGSDYEAGAVAGMAGRKAHGAKAMGKWSAEGRERAK